MLLLIDIKTDSQEDQEDGVTSLGIKRTEQRRKCACVCVCVCLLRLGLHQRCCSALLQSVSDGCGGGADIVPSLASNAATERAYQQSQSVANLSLICPLCCFFFGFLLLLLRKFTYAFSCSRFIWYFWWWWYLGELEEVKGREGVNEGVAKYFRLFLQLFPSFASFLINCLAVASPLGQQVVVDNIASAAVAVVVICFLFEMQTGG